MLTPEKQKFILDEDEYKSVVKAVLGNQKAVIIQGSLIPLAISPTIVSFQRWYASENERLKMTQQRLCRLCLSIMSLHAPCVCWKETGLSRDQDPFDGILTPTLKNILIERIGSLPDERIDPEKRKKLLGKIEQEFLDRSRKPRQNLLTPEKSKA